MTQTICLGTPTCSPVNSTYAYDESNRLLSVNGTAYTWDNNGNLLNDGANTYAYDAANRLTSVVGGGNTSTYSYNGLGDRLSQTVNAATTDYVLDLNAGLTQVLSDGSNTYLYGAMRIGELQAGGMAYHLGDALGSVRQLTDASGSVTLARNFEPYGSTLSSAGSGSSVWQFTGEARDASTGLTFLRARYLSSQTGRFVSRDLWAGDASRPMTQHGYLYSYANPILYTDPSGHDPWWCEGRPNEAQCTQAYINSMSQFRGQRGVSVTATLIATATCTPTPTATLTPTPTATATATLMPNFDPQIGPIFPVQQNWNYKADPSLRDDLAGVVLDWLRYYQGADAKGNQPAWWKNSARPDGLDVIKIKAWILEGEAAEFFNITVSGEQPHPISIMASELNSYLGDSLDPVRLAAYTFFFDPTLGLSFDTSDWSRWKIPPTIDSVNRITASGNTVPKGANKWWAYHEIPCDKRKDAVYTFAYTIPGRTSASDGANFYFGTPQQFVRSGIGGNWCTSPENNISPIRETP